MAAVRSFLIQEWDAARESRFESLTRNTFPLFDKGYVTLSERPGLGIEMNWEEWGRSFPYKRASLRAPGGR